MYALDEYDYALPPWLIAQTPASRRDNSRLLHLDRKSGTLAHLAFCDLPDLLQPSDLLVINTTRVIPGRLHGYKESGGKAEVLILNYGEPGAGFRADDGRWVYRCLIRASKRPGPGTRIR
ncbi:S-adenosylmethionine:tRNA ribosyltransferase-isomerase, partial [Desulfosarcina sp. OttesenSCG-928-G17]|nr:S-adenosylmethionine:tRNA ribosyltransferase-isomerase [Desulfosarcina sp. OttesenSCG-928-G17]